MMLDLLIRATVVLAVTIAGYLVLRRASAAARHLQALLGLVAALALPAVALSMPTWHLGLLDGTSVRVDSAREADDATGGHAAPDAALLARRTWPRTTPPPTDSGATRSRPDPLAATEPHRDARAQTVRWTALADESSGEDRDPDEQAGAGLVDPRAVPGAGDAFVREPSRPATAAASGWPRSIDPLWFLIAWALGAAIVLARLATGWWRMAVLALDASPLECAATWEIVDDCRRRLGLVRVPRILVSRQVRVPALWGYVRPTLLLPATAAVWPAERLRSVLLHELAHLRRRDGLALLIGRLAAAAWWFHPVVWWVERLARRDCERACDDLVLATGERPSTYARHLLQIAGELPGARAVPAGALSILGPDRLESRVRSILHPEVRRGLRPRRAAFLLSAVTVGLVAVAGISLQAAPAVEEPVRPVRVVAPAVAPTPPSPPSPLTREIVRVTPLSPLSPLSPQSPPSAPAIATAPSAPTPPREMAISVVPAPAPVVATVPGVQTLRLRPVDVIAAHDGDHRHSSEGRRAYQRAAEAYRDEDWSVAADLYREAAGEGYMQANALYNAACSLALAGEASAGVDVLEQAIDAGFDDFDHMRRDSDFDPIRRDPAFRRLMEDLEERGEMRGRGDRYDEAIEVYEDLLDSDSDDGDDWYGAGSALLRLRDLDRAIDALERAAEHLGDSNSNALYNLACAHSLAGDEGNALDSLERAVLAGFDSDERFENDSDLNNIRDTRRFAGIREMHDTLSLDRFQRSSWNIRNSNYSARRWAPAVEEFTEFTRKNPGVGRGWANLGLALHYSREHADARRAFERQLDLGHRAATATYNIACTYAMEGNEDAALDWLDRAVETGSFGPHMILNDEDLEDLRDDDRFEDILDRAAELNDTRWEWNSEGNLMRRFRNVMRDLGDAI